jgi:hypothetical protein
MISSDQHSRRDPAWSLTAMAGDERMRRLCLLEHAIAAGDAGKRDHAVFAE